MTTLALLLAESTIRWTDEWTVIVSVIALLVSISVAIGSLLWQKRLEQRRLKVELFRERYRLYKKLVILGQSSEYLLEDAASVSLQFQETADRARFLFPSQTLRAIYDFTFALKAVMSTQKPPQGWTIDHPETHAYVERLKIVNSAYSELERRLTADLMLVDNERSWWQKVTDWVDRSELCSNENARKRMGLN